MISMKIKRGGISAKSKMIFGAIIAGVVIVSIALLSSARAQEVSKSATDPSSTADYFAQVAENNRNMVLNAGSTAPGSPFSMGNLLAGMIFGAIGFGAFIYGKKNAAWRPMVLGIALMGFPYLPMGTGVLYLVGALLTAALFFWRD